MKNKDTFDFKQFTIWQDKCAMKVGTDAVLLGAWARGGKRVLDIGCGTGIISLMMAQRFPQAEITAIDIVKECCEQTRENADRTKWGDRISVVHQSLQDYAAENAGKIATDKNPLFDAIVSNPPFFVDSLKNPDDKRTLARHTYSLPFSTLLRGASALLTDDGVFSVMIPEECFKDFEDEAWFSELYLVEDLAIKTTPKRPVRRHLMLFAKKRPEQVVRTQVLLQNADGSRSDWYKKFAEDFYL